MNNCHKIENNIVMTRTNLIKTASIFVISSLILNACIVDTCEGSAFYERAIQMIFLDGDKDVRTADPIRITINGALDTIAEDGLIYLDEWHSNNTHRPENIDLNETHVLEYQLEFLQVVNSDTSVVDTDIVNFEYTLQNGCSYLDIETMVVRYNDEIIFDGTEFGAFSHSIRK